MVFSDQDIQSAQVRFRLIQTCHPALLTSVALTLNRYLVRAHSPDDITMLVPHDGVIYIDKVVALCTSASSSAKGSEHSPMTDWTVRKHPKPVHQSSTPIPISASPGASSGLDRVRLLGAVDCALPALLI